MVDVGDQGGMQSEAQKKKRTVTRKKSISNKTVEAKTKIATKLDTAEVTVDSSRPESSLSEHSLKQKIPTDSSASIPIKPAQNTKVRKQEKIEAKMKDMGLMPANNNADSESLPSTPKKKSNRAISTGLYWVGLVILIGAMAFLWLEEPKRNQKQSHSPKLDTNELGTTASVAPIALPPTKVNNDSAVNVEKSTVISKEQTSGSHKIVEENLKADTVTKKQPLSTETKSNQTVVHSDPHTTTLKAEKAKKSIAPSAPSVDAPLLSQSQKAEAQKEILEATHPKKLDIKTATRQDNRKNSSIASDTKKSSAKAQTAKVTSPAAKTTQTKYPQQTPYPYYQHQPTIPGFGHPAPRPYPHYGYPSQ